jgi:hypothetical protein
VNAELSRLKRVATGTNGANATDACLTALAVMGGLIEYEVRPSPALIDRCGAAAWLIQATDALILDSLLSSVDGGGGGG